MEQPLDPRLQSALKNLPEEDLSMAWRSNLNQKLMVAAKQQQQQKSKLRWIWGSSAGMAMASAFVVLALIPRGAVNSGVITAPTTLESQLVGVHQEASVMDSINGSGVSYTKSETDPNDDLLSPEGESDYL